LLFEFAAHPSDRAFYERAFGLELASQTECAGSIPVICSTLTGFDDRANQTRCSQNVTKA
jgi:hypothetical protein